MFSVYKKYINLFIHCVHSWSNVQCTFIYIYSVISKWCLQSKQCWPPCFKRCNHVSELNVTPCQNFLGNKNLGIKWNREQHNARSVTLSASKYIIMLSKQIQSWDLLRTIFDLNWLLHYNVLRSPKMTTTGVVEYKYHKSYC